MIQLIKDNYYLIHYENYRGVAKFIKESGHEEPFGSKKILKEYHFNIPFEEHSVCFYKQDIIHQLTLAEAEEILKEQLTQKLVKDFKAMQEYGNFIFTNEEKVLQFKQAILNLSVKS